MRKKINLVAFNFSVIVLFMFSYIVLNNSIANANPETEGEIHLGNIYFAYAQAKQCFQARKGYAYVYISPAEIAEIKSIVKAAEKGLFNKFPGLEMKSDLLWKRHTKIYSYTEWLDRSGKGEDGKPIILQLTPNMEIDPQILCDGVKSSMVILKNALGGQVFSSESDRKTKKDF